MRKLPRAGTLAELLVVALPLMVSTGSASLQFLIDRIFLTWYSTDAVAAAFSAGIIHWTIVSLAVGTVSYVNTFVSQYVGAGEDQRVGAVLWQGIYLSLAAGAVIALLALAAPGLFALMGHDASIRSGEVEFFSVMCAGSLPLFISSTLACFFTGRGQTRIVMAVNVLATLVTIACDYLLIFGKGGLPECGVRGAAIATVASYCSSTALYLVALARSSVAARFGLWSGWRLDGALLRRLLRFGLPNGVQYFVDVICFTVFIQLVGGISPLALKSTALAFNLNTLTFMPLLGLGTAVMTLIGQRIGEGRPELAVRTTWFALAVGEAVVALFGAVYIVAPETILQFYAWGAREGAMDEVGPQVKQLLLFVATYSWFDAMALLFSSATRGAGDTRFAVIFSFTSGVLFLVLPTWAMMACGGGLLAAWLAVTLFISVLGIGFLLRFLQGKWKTMRVIERVN